MVTSTELTPLYVFYPDQKVESTLEWPENPPKGTVVYDPADVDIPWFECTGQGYSGYAQRYDFLPAWIKAYALLI